MQSKKVLYMPQTRRQFLLTTASAGLLLAIDEVGAVTGGATPIRREEMLLGKLRISTDGTVTLLHTTTELGQGTPTALAQLVADQLDIDWSHVRIEQAPVAPPFVTEKASYSTAGSSGIRSQWEQMRKLGATARVLLITAAANRWGVPANECSSEAGQVVHKSTRRRLRYAELAEAAARLPIPAEVTPRAIAETKLIGRSPERFNAKAKVTGAYRYGIDTQFADLCVATIMQCPVPGGRLALVDEAPARAVAGVIAVVKLVDAVAVVAKGYWPARQGLAALKPQWNITTELMDSAGLSARLRKAAMAGDGIYQPPSGLDPVEHRSTVDAAMAASSRVIEAVYEAPLAAHATMEPQNATARVTKTKAELWLPTQDQKLAQRVVAEELNLALDKVIIHTTGVGGGFGRRLEADYALQVVRIAKAVNRPVKLIWSREEDLQQDYYRPPASARLRAAFDASGQVTAWRFDTACPSIMDSSMNGEPVAAGKTDFTAFMGLRNAYALPRPYLTWTKVESGLRSGWWRAVGNSQNCFFVESFIDEIAQARGIEPLSYRQQLLAAAPRESRVLEALIVLAQLGTAPPKNHHRGIAMISMSGSVVAQAVELSVEAESRVRLHRITCVMDCGIVVHPSAVKAQIEGSIAWGLSSCFLNEITLREGRVEQSNFHDYPLLRMPQLPPLAIQLLTSDLPPGGAGEEAVPPVAPAIANALFAATGRRVRELPFKRAGFTLAA
jgi:isoquinoline 1-oxidoreductase subunit beta